MPVNLKTEGEFIQRLYREGRINFADVYGIFYKTPKDANPKTMRTVLLGYYLDGRTGQLRVVERDTDKPVSLSDDEVTQTPSAYDVVFNQLQTFEHVGLGMKSGRLMVEDEEDEGESEVYVIWSESITVYGTPKVGVAVHGLRAVPRRPPRAGQRPWLGGDPDYSGVIATAHPNR